MKANEFILAQENQKQLIKNLLTSSQLPIEDVDDHIHNFILAMNNNKILGTIGIEIYNDNGLIRSFAVTESNRNNGIGEALLHEIVNYSKKKNIKVLYLLTTTAEKYFYKYGFNTISRELAPSTIKETKEFKDICPKSSVCMKLNLQL